MHTPSRKLDLLVNGVCSYRPGFFVAVAVPGLHIQEALSYLDVLLYKLEGRHKSCFVITGTGHHSAHKHLHPKKQARLLPAVTQYLDDAGYQYADASSKHGGRGGMLEVKL